MKIVLYGDSLTAGIPGVAYFDYLQRRLPEHKFFNRGYGGDTVISLYRRIVRRKLDHPVDVSFLFVGVNDILVHVSWNFPLLKALFRQPWAKDDAEFAAYYRQILDLLSSQASQVFAVSSLFVGEDVANEWNQRLVVLGGVINEVSADYGNVDYLDVWSEFAAALDGRQISSYVLRTATRVILDAWLLRNEAQVDRMSAARRLQLTLDGVHLNSKGARLVAESFATAIRGLSHMGPCRRVFYE